MPSSCAFLCSFNSLSLRTVSKTPYQVLQRRHGEFETTINRVFLGFSLYTSRRNLAKASQKAQYKVKYVLSTFMLSSWSSKQSFRYFPIETKQHVMFRWQAECVIQLSRNLCGWRIQSIKHSPLNPFPTKSEIRKSQLKFTQA